MMSSGNNRSPIMMNIKDKSPIKKICKAARRGTKQAATAAHNGSQLYEHVQTRIAEADKDKSPSRHNRISVASKSNAGMDSAAYRSKVRDQINRFNSAGATSQKSNHSGDNYKKERRHHREHDIDNCTNLDASADNILSSSSYDTNSVEKENEANKSVSLSTTTSSYSFTNKDGIKALSPAMHRQRRKLPKKASSSPKPSSSAQKKSPRSRPESSPSRKTNTENSTDETEQLRIQLRALERDNEKLMKRNSRLERKNEMLTEKLEEKAAINQDSSTSRRTSHSDASNNNCRKPTADISQDALSNKRDPEIHPLIDSPLRKHMKMVHESAQSNCTVTMTKAPFPLLPPEESRAILEARRRTSEEVSHMDMVDNENHKSSLEVDANFALSYKKRQEKCSMDDEGKEEEAVDLLTSAAFMFKTSRRNLL